ncbi:MAG: hypothetical protein ABJN69_14695 [Hellea sp.]
MFSFFNKKEARAREPSVPAAEINPILSVLDHCAEAFTFPMLDNGYVYLAASRLSVYHSSDDWALVIEVFGFSPRAGAPAVAVHTFGSNLRNRKSRGDYVSQEAYENYISNNEYNEFKTFFPIGGDDIWVNADDNESVMPNTSLYLRGKVFNLPDDTAYLNHGITLEETSPQIYELCRYLGSVERQAVLATDDERRYNVPDHLSEVLSLDDWQHPDIAAGEKPSSIETFQQIAQILLSGDVLHYHPTVEGNTHWRHWPESGLL